DDGVDAVVVAESDGVMAERQHIAVPDVQVEPDDAHDDGGSPQDHSRTPKANRNLLSCTDDGRRRMCLGERKAGEGRSPSLWPYLSHEITRRPKDVCPNIYG